MECYKCEELREELVAVRRYCNEQAEKKADLQKELRIAQGVINGMQKEIDNKE